MITVPFTTDRHPVNRVNDYIRVRMREDGFYRRLVPPIVITNDELDRAVPTGQPFRAWTP